MNTSKRFITSCSDKAPITSISSGHLFSCHAEKDMAVAVQRSHYIKQLQLVVITKLKQYSPGCSQRCCSEKSVSYNSNRQMTNKMRHEQCTVIIVVPYLLRYCILVPIYIPYYCRYISTTYDVCRDKYYLRVGGTHDFASRSSLASCCCCCRKQLLLRFREL